MLGLKLNHFSRRAPGRHSCYCYSFHCYMPMTTTFFENKQINPLQCRHLEFIQSGPLRVPVVIILKINQHVGFRLGSRAVVTYNWTSHNPVLRGSLAGYHGPFDRYVKLRVAHAPGMPGTFSPPPRVSDPDMHHGTCVTHVP